MESLVKLLPGRITAFNLQLMLFALILLSCGSEEDKDRLPCYDCPSNFTAIDYEAAWSPDGQWIAYYHEDTRPGYSGIYRIRPDGSDNTLWLPGAQTPAWSPDSEWLAYSENAQIWIREVRGDSIVQLTFEGRNFSPAWSSDGGTLAFVQSICTNIPCGTWLSEFDSTPQIAVLYGRWSDFHPSKPLFIYSRPWWIQDDGDILGDSVFFYDATSKKTTFFKSLTGSENFDNRYYRFNNSGGTIVFTSQSSETGSTSIFLMDADAGEIRKLIEYGYAAEWSPDGRSIAYTNSNPENGRLHILDMESNNKRQITFEHSF